ncbi:RagB/SusD family nutrient uptake outer membrane protein [Salegentibacter salegens]|uniref:SusD family protein n=1 Tax=Salegentibacter salegens TaxID=143223 RepID=A0A1M7IIZ2_9FLAO|nr:RagB/SusD family nutrient uptake outer membrane protein [Salegentibacter salegens]PRX40399.1 SusD-like starch-binding protein associating with outer membrane [Salegentibacter salegens]SHM40543.1 SusD family protein [Salegentibacter salegens]
MYSAAAEKLKEVIDSGVYNLLPNYAAVFDPDNDNNDEIIFSIQFLAGGIGEGNPWPNSFAPINSGNAVIPFGGGGNNQPTTDMINSYEPGDQRKDFSIATSYESESGEIIPTNFVTKYQDEPATSGDNDNDIPIIRYADILLMYAEALNELGYESPGEAFIYLNEVRERAGLMSLSSAEVSSQEEFRLAIEKERRVELAFEGHRWFDLVRTDRAIPVMNAKKDEMELVKTLTENEKVFPIPQSVIDVNPDQIQQNPGY